MKKRKLTKYMKEDQSLIDLISEAGEDSTDRHILDVSASIMPHIFQHYWEGIVSDEQFKDVLEIVRKMAKERGFTLND